MKCFICKGYFNKNLINEKRLFRAFLHTLSSDFWPLAGKARISSSLQQKKDDV